MDLPSYVPVRIAVFAKRVRPRRGLTDPSLAAAEGRIAQGFPVCQFPPADDVKHLDVKPLACRCFRPVPIGFRHDRPDDRLQLTAVGDSSSARLPRRRRRRGLSLPHSLVRVSKTSGDS